MTTEPITRDNTEETPATDPDGWDMSCDWMDRLHPAVAAAEVNEVLEEILQAHLPALRQRRFFVEVPYNRVGCNLSRVFGAYIDGLYGLIHHILYDHFIYHRFLDAEELREVEHLVAHHPHAILCPMDEAAPQYEPKLRYIHDIHFRCMSYVRDRMLALGVDITGTDLLIFDE